MKKLVVAILARSARGAALFALTLAPAAWAASPMVAHPPADFAGTGRSALIWHNTNGAAALWLMNGTTQTSATQFGPYTGWSVLSGDADFNGDGKSDLLWTHTNGAAAVWLMNGTTQVSAASFGPYPGWSVVSGNHDFNGDGKSDLLWKNTDGSVAIWLMNGTTVLSQASFGPYPGWSIVSGNNDFNGDGKSDLLWKNSNGAAALWLMDGITQTSATQFGPYTGWSILSGSSDYDGDGKTDLLWSNSNGAAALWLMNGLTQTSATQFGPYTGWTVVPGRRDFNGDGKSDLLWTNTNGAAAVWLMNGLTQTSAASFGPFTGWSITGGIGDYNGDGMTDLLWSNSDGSAAVWLMNGIGQTSAAGFGPYLGWLIMPLLASPTVTYSIDATSGSSGHITPSGTTTVARGASQAYAITPNSGYAIAALVIDGSAVAASAAYTFTDVQANHTIGATFSAAPAAGIALSLVPARSSGVAPLSVFFDASGTTDAGVTSRPFHDLEYAWNFGDPGAGTWANGARPGISGKNSASGPVAAHVFETPGTYTVSVSASDGSHSATTSTTITVTDPDVVFAGTNTICFSTSATYAGCPAGATHVQTADFAAAINTYQNSNRRLLFRRGETFIAASSGTISKTGPGIVGAFGTGTLLPIAKITTDIPVDGKYPIIQLSGPSTPGIGDWRFMDLDIDGSFVKSSDVSGIGANGGFNQFLALRLNIHDIWRGIAAGPDILDWWNNHGNPGHTIFDQWAVVDSTMNAIPGCNSPGNYNCDWRVYLAAKHSTVQGNFLDNQNTGGSHVLRSEYTAKGVFSNNTLARAGDFQLAIKLHAKNWTTASVANPGAVGTYSEQVVIADNKIIGGINPWTISLGPQDELNDERVRDIIVERNWFTAGSASQVHMHINSSETTIRDNICDLTGAAYHTCVLVDQWGVTPAPANVRVFNNTFYSGSTGDYVGVEIGTATNTTVWNNLGSAPQASDPVMISGTGTGLVQSNNVLNNAPSALFVSATPAAPADFRLKSLPNPARDTGLATVPVLSDFFRTGRPQNGAIDIGAIEGP